MSVIIANAFSLGMIPEWMISDEEGFFTGATLSVREVTKAEVLQEWGSEDDDDSDLVWAVGHQDTSQVLGQELFGRDVPMKRVSFKLYEDDILFVAQLQGGRLPEGTKKLPDGFKFKWLAVTIEPSY